MRRATVAVLAVMLIAGCAGSGDDAAEGDDPSTTSSTPTPTTPDETLASNPAEAEVEAAYLAYWEMGERLLQAPDPSDPEIDRRTTGEVRGAMVDSLTTLKAQNSAVRYGDQYAHSVLSVEIDAQEAEVRDCLVDDGEVINETSGEAVRSGVVTVLYRTTMVHVGGEWLASDAVREQSWDGVVQCGG
jgi:hypothetical protein